jgi:hypothetical protein
MAKIDFEGVFWIWLNATSAAVITGDKAIAGGQAHLAFGRSGAQVKQFLKGTGIRQKKNEWLIPLEPFGDLPAFDLPIYQNPQDAQRAGECRLPSQSPTSHRSYGLWQRTTVPLESEALPQQFILLLRDGGNRFYARVLSIAQLRLLPPQLRSAIYENRQGNQHFLKIAGAFKDDAPLPDKPKKRRPRIARPQTNTTDSEKWRTLARRTIQAQSQTRMRRVRQIETNLRDPQTRQNAIECFGERCQVQDCICTLNLEPVLLPLTLEVHHLKAVADQGDDSLFNLSVLCANHHNIFEKLKLQVTTEGNSDDVILFNDDHVFLLERNLDALRQALQIVEAEE